MSQYQAIKAATDAYIKSNGRREITGAILNSVMIATINSLGRFYQSVGVATPNTDPGVLDQNVAYIAGTAGTYTNLGGFELVPGEVAVLKFDGEWKKDSLIVIPTKVSELINDLGFITNAVSDLINYYTKDETFSKTEVTNILSDYYDKDEMDSIVNSITRQSYVVAWDGSAEPIVADIPAGVVVTYGGNPYTGTLAASESTTNKIYLVSNGAGYDEYITTENSGYAWVNIGTTSLDLSGYATKAELTQLEQKVDDIDEQINGESGGDIEVEESSNETGYRLLYADGTTVSTTLVYVVRKFPVIGGDNYKVSGRVGSTGGAPGSCLYAFYDANDIFISAGITTQASATGYLNVPVTAPSNATSIKVAGSTSNDYDASLLHSVSGSPGLVDRLEDVENDFQNLEQDVEDVEQGLNDLSVIVEIGVDKSTDFVKEVTESEGFSNIYPVDIKAGTYRLTYTNTISVETGTYLRYYYGDNTYTQTANIGSSGDIDISFSADVVAIRIMTIGFLSAGTITMHFEDKNKVLPITEEITDLKDNVADNSADILELQAVVGIVPKNGYLRTSGTIETGEKLTLGENNISINKHLSFVGYFSSFGTLRIGHGYNNPTASWIEIDSTNLYIFRGESLTAVKTQAHGLTIQNNIQVEISVNDTGVPVITVQSMGESYTLEHYMWYGTKGEIFAESVSGTYNGCVLSWTCNGYKAEVHIYGDSYCGSLSDQRWPYYLLRSGFNNCLLDAYGGRDSTNALPRFLENVQHTTPKFALWLLGMNDADSDSAINSTWLTKVQAFLAKCSEENITPILATIPNVPSRVMTFKNAWVKASGYRYIDFAKAVNAESSGATWYTGMLSNDNLHPTALGAKTLYKQVLSDFPEIMSYPSVTIGGKLQE